MLGWTNAWNHIIRNVIFKDAELKRLMKIPKQTGVIQFTERYFIKATNELLTDEVCRINYSDVQGSPTDVPNIKRNMLVFDIYVQKDELRGVGDDGLITRTDLIADRLDKLLRSHRYLAGTGFRFEPAGAWDMDTRTAGYKRYTVAYYYMKVY